MIVQEPRMQRQLTLSAAVQTTKAGQTATPVRAVSELP
jgi:hypothetical protein